MKITLGILTLIALVACQPEAKQPTEPLVDQITAKDATDLLKKWEEAMIDKDAAKLGEVLHAEYQYSGSPDGSTADRAAMMEWVVSDPNTLLSQTFYDMDIKLYGDVAVVRGWEVMVNRTPEGDTIEFKLRFTDVYQKEKGVTRALATHSSPMD